MELRFLPEQNYSCVMCAKGCEHSWRIHTDPHTQEGIEKSPLALRVIQELGLPSVLEDDPQGGPNKLLVRHEGRCVFLQPNRLCAVHAEMGLEAKPIGCRWFPFQMAETPDGLFVGISYYCTAAQQNHGKPYAEQAPEARALLALHPAPQVGFQPLGLTASSEAFLDWPSYRHLEAAAQENADRVLWALAELAGFAPPGLIPEQAVEVSLARARPELFTTDPLLQDMDMFHTAVLIGMIEAEAEARAISEGLLTGQPVTVAGWTGTLQQVQAVRLPEWVEQELGRYYRATVFRKFLAMDRGVLDNAVALHLMPGLFRFYTAVGCLKHGGCERRDAYAAMDVLEMFFSHMRWSGLDQLLGAFAQAYVQQVPLVAA